MSCLFVSRQAAILRLMPQHHLYCEPFFGGGAIYTSATGRGGEWTAKTSNTTEVLIDIVRASNQFVAVGNAGTILTSSDGATWTSRTSGTTQDLRAVCAK